MHLVDRSPSWGWGHRICGYVEFDSEIVRLQIQAERDRLSTATDIPTNDAPSRPFLHLFRIVIQLCRRRRNALWQGTVPRMLVNVLCESHAFHDRWPTYEWQLVWRDWISMKLLVFCKPICKWNESGYSSCGVIVRLGSPPWVKWESLSDVYH